MSCDIGRRCGSDLALLRLWHRLDAVAQIKRRAENTPKAGGEAKKKKTNNKNNKKKKKHFNAL